MANYLKRIQLANLTGPQITSVVNFLEGLGLTASQASNTKQLVLQSTSGVVSASVVTEVDGATDSSVLDDMIAGNVVQLLVR